MTDPVVIMSPDQLTIDKLHMPDHDEIVLRLRANLDEPELVLGFYPAVAAKLAGRRLVPLGVLNGIVLALVTYTRRFYGQDHSDLLHRVMLMAVPTHIDALFADDDDTSHQMQCLWLWFCQQGGLPHLDLAPPPDEKPANP